MVYSGAGADLRVAVIPDRVALLVLHLNPLALLHILLPPVGQRRRQHFLRDPQVLRLRDGVDAEVAGGLCGGRRSC